MPLSDFLVSQRQKQASLSYNQEIAKLAVILVSHLKEQQPALHEMIYALVVPIQIGMCVKPVIQVVHTHIFTHQLTNVMRLVLTPLSGTRSTAMIEWLLVVTVIALLTVYLALLAQTLPILSQEVVAQTSEAQPKPQLIMYVLTVTLPEAVEVHPLLSALTVLEQCCCIGQVV